MHTVCLLCLFPLHVRRRQSSEQMVYICYYMDATAANSVAVVKLFTVAISISAPAEAVVVVVVDDDDDDGGDVIWEEDRPLSLLMFFLLLARL